MKKLTNVSPFILLLVPVFFVMLITLSLGNKNTNQKEIAAKTVVANSGTIAQTATLTIR